MRQIIAGSANIPMLALMAIILTAATTYGFGSGWPLPSRATRIHDYLSLAPSSADNNIEKNNNIAGSSDDQNSHLFTLKKRNPYDVHVYYDGPDERQAAMKLRQKMQERFQWMRFYAPKDRPIGPHPVPMWEADFGSYDNRNLWKDVCDFINDEHGDLSVLIHPHSLDGDYADHTKNSFWAGEVKELRIQGWRR